MNFNALSRQREIYIHGVAGIKPIIPVDFPSLEQAARQTLSSEAFAYIAGGAGMESTMQANRSAWDKYAIVPRVLKPVGERKLSKSIFGKTYPLPLFISPIGVLELAHPEGDLAVAHACRRMGVPMMVSNQASHTMEEIAGALAGSPWYFQLYVSRSDELVSSFVKRAEQAGAHGIVITLDTTMLGWRTRDLNLSYLPFLQGKGIAQYTSDPVFQKLCKELPPDQNKKKINLHSISSLLRLAGKIPGSYLENLKGRALDSVRTFTSIYSRPDLNWEVIEKIKSNVRLPVILKGIQHPEEAVRAMEAGIDAIYVSNHGGRQVDGAIGSIDALARISTVVNKKIPVLFDSGVRCGSDILKALALGADMVGIGRPYAYALALAGEKGVEELILNMAADFELNMALSGMADVGRLDRSLLISSQ